MGVALGLMQYPTATRFPPSLDRSGYAWGLATASPDHPPPSPQSSTLDACRFPRSVCKRVPAKKRHNFKQVWSIDFGRKIELVRAY